MTTSVSTPGKVSKESRIEELISVSTIEEVDIEWVNEEIKFLETLAEEKSTFLKPSFKKDDAVKKLEAICNHASSTSKLMRVMFRLAKENFNSKQLCKEIVRTLETQNKAIQKNIHQTNKPDLTKSYANSLKNTAANSVKNPPPEVPVAKRPEITLIPKTNYENDLKRVSEKLKTQPVLSSRKSKAGNIVLRCDKDEDIGSIEQALKSENFVTVKKMQKNLPRMTIFDIGKWDSADVLKEGLFSKNSFLKAMVDDGKVFDVLFFKNYNDGVNVVIKCDPAIRESILKNRSRLFIGMKSCRVSDSFPFVVCFNCQKTCSHKSADCPLTEYTICRYCGENHLSKNCGVKDDTTKHFCVNCSKSDNNNIKKNCRTHVSNSTQCPLIKSIVNNMKSNTCYAIEQKNG